MSVTHFAKQEHTEVNSTLIEIFTLGICVSRIIVDINKQYLVNITCLGVSELIEGVEKTVK